MSKCGWAGTGSNAPMNTVLIVFNVKPRKFPVRVNTANIPEGYIVTGRRMQEAAIVHNGKTK